MTARTPVMGTVTRTDYHPPVRIGPCDLRGFGMLNCRDCRGETRVIAENGTEAATGGSQAVKKLRECVCGTRADSTETWDEDGTAEHYRARYEQEWLSQLAFLLRAPAMTARMADDWVGKDIQRGPRGGPKRRKNRR